MDDVGFREDYVVMFEREKNMLRGTAAAEGRNEVERNAKVPMMKTHYACPNATAPLRVKMQSDQLSCAFFFRGPTRNGDQTPMQHLITFAPSSAIPCVPLDHFHTPNQPFCHVATV